MAVKTKALSFQPGVDKVSMSKAGKIEAVVMETFLVEHIKHVDNEYYGVPFTLDDWQRKDIWEPIFGQGHKVKIATNLDGSPIYRFRRKVSSVLIGLPRNSGKSEIGVAILLCVASMENVANGEYAVIASSKNQALKDLKKLKTMIRLDDYLSSTWDCRAEQIVHQTTGATIEVMPYSEAAVQGKHYNAVVLDETHVYRDDAVYNAVVSGQARIANSLCVIPTTAGPERKGFLWDVIPQLRADKGAHVCWVGARDDDNIDDSKMWQRTHPMSWANMDQIRKMRDKLSHASFERYELNRFPLAKSADLVFNARQLNPCIRLEGQFDFSKPFNIGVDGAISGDTFAIVAHQIDEDGNDSWNEWIFDEPGEDGYYDFVQIEELIVYLHQKYNCQVGIDPARLLLMAQHLQDNYGVEIMQVPQSNKNMCPACGEVVRSVKQKRCALSNVPKLTEHLSNCVEVERQPYGIRFGSLAHGQDSSRIDAAIAASIAKFMTSTIGIPTSFAETGGLWSV